MTIEKKSWKFKPKTNRRGKVVTLDNVFSKYIRLRDSWEQGGVRVFKCISCGQIKRYEMADAGHYFSRNNMATRWDEDNVHAECSACNRFKGDHMINYTPNLVQKLEKKYGTGKGVQHYELLRLRHNEVKKWTEFELDVLIKYYKDKIKSYEN